MKKHLFITLFSGLAAFAAAQNYGSLMGSIWTGSSELSAQVNVTKGSFNTLSTLTNVKGLWMGTSAVDPVGQRYFNNTDVGLLVIDMTTGAIQSVISSGNFKGMEYNSNSGKLVGSYWNGSAEIFASLDLVTGALTSHATLGGITTVAQGMTTFDVANNRYFMRTGDKIYIIDAATGAVLNTIPNILLKNWEYNPNTGELIGTYWTGSAEVFGSLNLTTGAMSGLAVMSGVTSVVQGESAYDPINDLYYFRTSYTIKVINASTGALVKDITVDVHFKGMECMGSASPGCTLSVSLVSPNVVVATVGSAVTITATCNDPSAQFTWQSNPAGFGWMNVPVNASYAGANINALTINNVSLSNHGQPFKLIAESGECIDTTDIAVLQLSDTCIVTDTILILNSDTLVLDITAKKDKGQISVYPVPANDELILDCSGIEGIDGATLSIFDHLGREILTSSMPEARLRLEIRSITQRGIYLLSIRNRKGDMLGSTRFIVEK